MCERRASSRDVNTSLNALVPLSDLSIPEHGEIVPSLSGSDIVNVRKKNKK